MEFDLSVFTAEAAQRTILIVFCEVSGFVKTPGKRGFRNGPNRVLDEDAPRLFWLFQIATTDNFSLNK